MLNAAPSEQHSSTSDRASAAQAAALAARTTAVPRSAALPSSSIGGGVDGGDSVLATADAIDNEPRESEASLNSMHFLAMGAFAKLMSTSITYPLQVCAREHSDGKKMRLYRVLTRRVLVFSVLCVLILGVVCFIFVLADSSLSPALIRQVLRARMFRRDLPSSSSMVDVARSVYRSLGARGFYQGFVPYVALREFAECISRLRSISVSSRPLIPNQVRDQDVHLVGAHVWRV